MKRKYFYLLILISALALVACSKNSTGNQAQSINQSKSQQEANATSTDRNFPGSENYSPGAFSDLSVDAYVMVFGATADDGSINADRIIISQSEADFENMKNNFRPMQPPTGTADQNITPPNANGALQGDRPERPNFENMTEEERAQFRERMAANGAGPNQGFQARNSKNMTRLIGQILNINEEEKIITVKNTDGGSKFVYISGSTMILMPKK